MELITQHDFSNILQNWTVCQQVISGLENLKQEKSYSMTNHHWCKSNRFFRHWQVCLDCHQGRLLCRGSSWDHSVLMKKNCSDYLGCILCSVGASAVRECRNSCGWNYCCTESEVSRASAPCDWLPQESEEVHCQMKFYQLLSSVPSK